MNAAVSPILSLFAKKHHFLIRLCLVIEESLLVLVFFSVAIYLDCAWSANGGRKEKIRKSQVGNQLLKLYFGTFFSTDALSAALLQSAFLAGREDGELDQAVIPWILHRHSGWVSRKHSLPPVEPISKMLMSLLRR